MTRILFKPLLQGTTGKYLAAGAFAALLLLVTLLLLPRPSANAGPPSPVSPDAATLTMTVPFSATGEPGVSALILPDVEGELNDSLVHIDFPSGALSEPQMITLIPPGQHSGWRPRNARVLHNRLPSPCITPLRMAEET
jgi:hypothetical protein